MRLATHPDMIWQFSRHLKKQLALEGWDQVEIYAHGAISINGASRQPLIDPEVDLLSVEWHHFRHNPWILDQKPSSESLD